MTKGAQILLAAAVLAAGVAGTVFISSSADKASGESQDRRHASRVDEVIEKAPSKDPVKALEEYVSTNASSKDSLVQNAVTRSRVKIAYAYADRKDFGKARSVLLNAAKEHRGTTESSLEWGTLSDQAAYQAIACLMAEKKDEQARRELLKFMKERKLSPLVQAAYRRLERIGGGKACPEGTHLFQQAINAQEKHIRFETSVCGPKSIQYLADKALIKTNAKLGYKEIAKLCGTTDKGTTVAGMRKGLKQLGVKSFAYRLNRRSLDSATLPAIILDADHYLVLEKISGGKAAVYDPRFQSARQITLPDADNPDFLVNVILFSPMEAIL